MSPKVVKAGDLSCSQLGKAIGNAMTQSVLEDVFKSLLPMIGF